MNASWPRVVHGGFVRKIAILVVVAVVSTLIQMVAGVLPAAAGALSYHFARSCGPTVVGTASFDASTPTLEKRQPFTNRGTGNGARSALTHVATDGSTKIRVGNYDGASVSVSLIPRDVPSGSTVTQSFKPSVSDPAVGYSQEKTFTGLKAGNYEVKVSPPNGSEFWLFRDESASQWVESREVVYER